MGLAHTWWWVYFNKEIGFFNSQSGAQNEVMCVVEERSHRTPHFNPEFIEGLKELDNWNPLRHIIYDLLVFACGEKWITPHLPFTSHSGS